jgi:hypothetical protein
MSQAIVANYSNNTQQSIPSQSRIFVNTNFKGITTPATSFLNMPPNTSDFYTWALVKTQNNLDFSIDYNGTPLSGTVLFRNIEKPIRSNSPDFLVGRGIDDSGLFYISGTYNGTKPFTFILRFSQDLSTFENGEMKVTLQQSVAPNASDSVNPVNNLTTNVNTVMNKNRVNNSKNSKNGKNNKKCDNNITTIVELGVQTDLLGLNLGEMVGILTSDHSYPNGYPKELIGYCEDINVDDTNVVQTFYSFSPNVSKVLKEKGDTLLAQTNNINKSFDTGLSNCDFYVNILAYCTFRYMLAGLSNDSVFSAKWLCANHYEQFLINLENSEFSDAVVIFTEPQENFDFTNFNRYFKSCNNKSHCH